MMNSLAGPLDFFFIVGESIQGLVHDRQAIHKLTYIPSSLFPYFMYL